MVSPIGHALTLRCDMHCRLWLATCDTSPVCPRLGVGRILGHNPRMDIQLNGEPRSLPASSTLLDLLSAEGLLERRVAVEVNGHIVTRSLHAGHVLAEGDEVEIVHALGGG